MTIPDPGPLIRPLIQQVMAPAVRAQVEYIPRKHLSSLYLPNLAKSLQSAPNPGLPSTSLYPSGGYRGRGGSVAPSNPEPVVLEAPKKPQCWDHGCNGRQFSTFSNLLRHQREKSGTSQKSTCHRCGAEFTRKTARDGHLAHDKCKPRSDR